MRTVLDVTGEPSRLALAWAAGAGAAGAYWPDAFGHAAARLPVFQPARDWLREVIYLADKRVNDLALVECEGGRSGPWPRRPDWWTTDDDGALHLEWDTSVSLVLSSDKDENSLRLVLYGEHAQREALVREALERPGQVRDRIIRSWRETVSAAAEMMTLEDDERALLARVGVERLEALVAYQRLVGRD